VPGLLLLLVAVWRASAALPEAASAVTRGEQALIGGNMSDTVARPAVPTPAGGQP